MGCKPRKLRSLSEGIIKPSQVDHLIRYTYTRPLTIMEFLAIFSNDQVGEEQLKKIAEHLFPNDSFIRKEPLEAAILSYWVKDFDELEGENIFDVFQYYNILSSTEHKPKDYDSLEDLVNLKPELLFTKGGDCKTRAVFLINSFRNYKFPCRLVRGAKGGENDHMWIEINYDGLWTPFEPDRGINLVSNEEAVTHYSIHSEVYFSKP